VKLVKSSFMVASSSGEMAPLSAISASMSGACKENRKGVSDEDSDS